MSALVEIGSSIKFFQSMEDYKKNIVYQEIPYGMFETEPYKSFIRKLIKKKRAISKQPELKKLIPLANTVKTKVSPWPLQAQFLSIMNKDKYAGILQSPAGSGKTNMFIFLIAKYNLYSLVIVPTSDLVEQTKDRILSVLDIPESMVGCYNATKKELRPITVSTWQSLENLHVRNLFIGYGFNMLLADEAHRASAEIYGEILHQYPARFKFGFSASPFHTQDENTEKMNALLGEIIYKIDIEDIYKEGNLLRPNICYVKTNVEIDIKDALIKRLEEKVKNNPRYLYYIKNQLQKKMKLTTGYIKDLNLHELCTLYFEIDKFCQKYSQALDKDLYPNGETITDDTFLGALGILKSYIDDSPSRHNVILDYVMSSHKNAKKAMVLFSTKEKCHKFQKDLEQYNINSVVITGDSKNKKEKLEHFKQDTSNYTVIGTTALLGEGTDIPPLCTIYVGSPEYPPFFDLARVIQVPGRAMRSHPGKTDANVVYFEDNIKHQWITRKAEEAKFLVISQLKPIIRESNFLLDKNRLEQSLKLKSKI